MDKSNGKMIEYLNVNGQIIHLNVPVSAVIFHIFKNIFLQRYSKSVKNDISTE